MSPTTSSTRTFSRFLLIGGLLAALLVAVPSAHGQDVSVNVPDTTVATGDTVSVPVSLSNLDQASGITAYGFELSFDSDSLAYVGFETGGTLSDTAGFTVDDNQDVPRIGGFGDTPLNDVSNEGTAVLLKFAVLGEGTAEVTLPNLQFNDGSPASTPAEPTFVLTGVPPNFPPVARADSYETATGTSLQVSGVSDGVLANDSDPNDDALAAGVGDSVSNGTITFESDGTFEYTPDSGFAGEDTFRYGASDPDGAVDSAAVTISVRPPNTPPTITGISDQTISEDGTAGPLAFTIGDSETAPGDLSVQSASNNQSLVPDDSISLEGTGENREISVAPASNESGTSQITVSVSDGRSSTSQEFQVSVQPVNDAPTGTDDQYRTPAGDTLQVVEPDRGVLSNDSDIEDVSLSAYVLDGVSNGDLSLDSTGTFDYVPNPGFTGNDEFTYVLADGGGASDTSTASIAVQPTDSVAISIDSVEVAPGNTVEVPIKVDGLGQAASITAYSFTLEYDETAVEYKGFSVDSTLSQKAGFTVEDNPEQGQIGAFADDSLSSAASGGVLLRLRFAALEEGTSVVALKDLQFNTGVPSAQPSEPRFVVAGDPPNRSPQASSDQYQVTEGSVLAAEKNAEGVLANDADPDEDSLTASLLESPTNGRLTFRDSGTFEYTPDSAFTGTDAFQYRASDPQGLQDSASVRVTVERDSAVAVALDDVRGNKGDTLEVPVRLDRLGQVDDITSFGFEVSFDTTKVDYVGFTSSGTLSGQASFTVDGNPDIPRIGGFGATSLNSVGNQGVMVKLEFQLLQSGSTDITLEELQFNEGVPPPNPSKPSSTVTTNPLDRPTALTDSFSVQEDSTLGVSPPGVLENDFNPKGTLESLEVSLVSGVSNGTLSLRGDGSFEYDPASNFTGEDTFVYRATDTDGASDTSTVRVAVQPLDNSPTLTAVAKADSVELSWTVSDPADVKDYLIYRDTAPIDSAAGPSGSVPLDSTEASATSYTDTTATAGTTYHYRVTAVDEAGNESGFSGEATATPSLPAVALASGGSGGLPYQPPAPEPGTDHNPVGRLQVAASQPGAALSALTVENDGSSLNGITSIEVWRSADPTFGAENDVLLAADTTTIPATFEDVGLSIPTDTTYLFLVVDLTDGATGEYQPVLQDEEALGLENGKLRTLNGQTDSSFSALPLSAVPAPLPVDLAAFDATVSEEAAVLTWTTASETDNAGFAVQHRADSTAGWKKLGFIESKTEGGSATGPQEYRFEAGGLKVGTHQFRLRQVDLDGSGHVSDAIRTEITMEEAYRLTSYPNPARRRATIEVTVREKQEVQVRLYDVLGRRVATLHDGPLPAQETKTLTVDARRQGLSSGMYFLRLRGEGFAGTSRLTIVK